MPRRLSDEELADLTGSWKNSTVDTSKYIQPILKAWEVDFTTFQYFMNIGGLCLETGEKFFIGV